MSGTFGKYEVVELIGQGGFGQVFRGRDPVLKRDVAIKTVSLHAPLTRERFLREAEIAAGLRHPNIVSIYDFGEQDGVPYLVQEFLPGEDLSQKIQRRDPVDIPTRIDWLIAVAEALQFAHRQGIVHRDVKPSNVRIVQDGTVRLVDFGIAKVLHSEQQLTGTNQSLGTSGYLAPEQLAGSEIDHRADIFSFGVLAYELLTYSKPFAAETVQATLYRILTADPAPLASLAPDVPEALAACVERCLRKTPDDRYPDFGPLIEELRGIRKPGATPTAAALAVPSADLATVPAARPTATSLLSPDAARRAVPEPAPAAPLPATASSNRMQKVAIAGAAIVALAAVAWGGTAAVSAMLGRGDRGMAPTAADSVKPDTATLAAADSTTEPQGSGAGTDVESTTERDGAAGGARTGASTDSAAAGTGGSNAGAGTVVTAPDTASAGDEAGSGVAIDPARVLVVIRGDVTGAVASAESTVLAELLAKRRPFVDPDAVAGIRADAAAMRALSTGGSPAVEVGREFGAGTVVVGELVADANETVAGLITGTAVLTAKYYDVQTGQMILSEKYQIGAGGVPGKAGVTATDAVTQAAEAVARQMSRAILQKTGG